MVLPGICVQRKEKVKKKDLCGKFQLTFSLIEPVPLLAII